MKWNLLSVVRVCFALEIGGGAALAQVREDWVTNSALRLTNVQPPQAGNYSVVVENCVGSTTSAVAMLTVRLEPPVLLSQPQSQTVAAGSNATFALAATGSLPLSYQWQFNGSDLGGSTNASLVLTNVQYANAGDYLLVVTNQLGSVTSAVAHLTVMPLLMPFSPGDRTHLVGEEAIFEIGLRSSVPVGYQWQFNGADIPGATNGSLRLPNLQLSDAGNYSVVVTNVFGSVTSKVARLTVVPLLIMEPPGSHQVLAGENVTFVVGASGPEPLNYQWRANATDLSGETNFVLTLTNVQPAQAGDYRVIVANSFGAVTSTLARLTVDPLRVSIYPYLRTVRLGSNATIGASAQSTVPVYYQWQFNGTDVTGATNFALSLSNLQPEHAGVYRVIGRNNYGAVTSGVARLSVDLPGPTDLWRWRNPLPLGSPLSAVAYGGGRFVAVGDAGAVAVSLDGVNWIAGESGTSAAFEHITFGNGRFVAAGMVHNSLFITSPYTNVVATSTNGFFWQSEVFSIGSFITDLMFAKGVFVALRFTPCCPTISYVMTSSDGVNWTNTALATNSSGAFQAIAYGHDRFVTIGSGGQIRFSPDLLTWSNASTGAFYELRDLTFGNGTFVGVTSSNIFTSPDGITWARQSPTTNALLAVTWADSLFLAVGNDGAVLTSSDGITWTYGDTGTRKNLTAITSGEGRVVAVGNSWRYAGDGIILSSPDNLSWTNYVNGARSDLRDVAYGNSTYVALGSQGTNLISTGGVRWVPQPLGAPVLPRSITFGNGIFVLVGSAGAILTSTDGVSWSNQISGTTVSLNDVSYGGGRFVAVGRETLLISADGVIWTRPAAVPANDWQAIAYGNGLFMAGGASRNIVTSADGVSWIPRTIFPVVGYPVRRIVFGNGQFVAFAMPCDDDDGFCYHEILTSPDCVSWQSAVVGPLPFLAGLAYGNETFVAVGIYGNILVSRDGLGWTPRDSRTHFPLYGVTYANGAFMAVGEYGTILQSDSFAPTRLLARSPSTSAGFELTLSGEPWQTYRLQTATELPATNWLDLLTLTLAQHTTNLVDTTATNFPQRFYRAVSP